MTVHADRAASPAPACTARGRGRQALTLFIFAAGATSAATPAAAQLGTVVSLFSDDRFRGYSLSEERPVAIFDLSYDLPDGFYAAASASAVAAREGVRPLGLQLNGGYARRLNSRLTLDVGAIHSTYSRYSGLTGARDYTEFYAGIAGHNISSRISVSPGYFRAGPTVHGEVDAHYALSRRLSVAGNVGLLLPLGRNYSARPVYDARLGLDRDFGRLSLHAAITSRGAGSSIYQGRSDRHALVLGASYRL